MDVDFNIKSWPRVGRGRDEDMGSTNSHNVLVWRDHKLHFLKTSNNLEFLRAPQE